MDTLSAFGQCRCCLKTGYHRDITKCYYRNGVREVYLDLFLDCFNLLLSTNPKLTGLICTSCTDKLHDALQFKTMVAENEQQLLYQIGSNTVFVNVPEASLHTEMHIKIEEIDVKEEEDTQEPMEYSTAHDDDMPEQDSSNTFIDIYTESNGLTNIDNDLVEGEAELIAKVSKYIRPLPKRDELYAICPGFAKHLNLLKDKVILPKMIEKLVDAELNIKTDHSRAALCSEKGGLVSNTALLLENSNLTPFKSKNRSGYPCFYCRHIFENLEKLREHQAKSHKKTELRKLLRTTGPESFVLYVDTTNLKCTICDESMKNINDLKMHLIKTHNKAFYTEFTDRVVPFKLTESNIYVCQICGFRLETFGSIERHMNTHFRNYICKDCGSGFVTKYRLKVHIKSMHIEGSYPCEQCKKVFSTIQKLKNHTNTVHRLIKRFKCPKCPERFSEYFKRQKHMVEAHNVAPLQYKCNVCDKSFDRRYTLSRHMKRDHLEERDFQCEMCSYKCFTNNELRVHMIKHNGERIYECTVCKKAYARKKTLKEHMRIHNNDRRFSCAICSQAFVQKCSLKGHMKTHHIEYNPIV